MGGGLGGVPQPLSPLSLSLLVAAAALGATPAPPALTFLEHPSDARAAPGGSVRLRCRARAEAPGPPPELGWERDGRDLDGDSDLAQVALPGGGWVATSQLRLAPLSESDSGRFRCWARAGPGPRLLSRPATLELAGLPEFEEEPRALRVPARAPFSLRCSARGAAGLRWLRDGTPLNRLGDPLGQSPSVLRVPGLNHSSSFVCEAHNERGVSSSRSATVTVVPPAPRRPRVSAAGPRWLELSWEPGEAPGAAGPQECVLQVVPADVADVASDPPMSRHAGDVTAAPVSRHGTDVPDASMSRHGTAVTAAPVSRHGTDVPDASMSRHGTAVTAAPVSRHGTDVATALMSRWAAAPPFRLRLAGLRPLSRYRARVACRDRRGRSAWSRWEPAATAEGVPEGPPQNLSARWVGEGRARLRWGPPRPPLNGVLGGFRVGVGSPAHPEQVLDVGLAQEASLDLGALGPNVSVRVAPYTGAGEGPWSPPLLLPPPPAEVPLETQLVRPPLVAGAGWPLLVALVALGTLALVALVALVALAARRRHKETRYGAAFSPAVRFRARSSYGRGTAQSTLRSLGLSEALQEQLREVLVERRRVVLGKALGQGEFGAVLEGTLQQDSGALRVAVKTMKLAVCSPRELEDFLSEAACMKDFDHPNVMKLIGVCLQPWGGAGRSRPLPPSSCCPSWPTGTCTASCWERASGTPHARLGDPPTVLSPQTLLGFMADIAAGMSYLSQRNFVHRDLAARNCMLDERLRVCVADFGLSRRVGRSQYYRQGRSAPVPVKWAALESLAERIYTTKSDVWSFGVTMWEVAAAGRTPYPGLDNAEVLPFLRGGRRLGAPPECPAGLYALMRRCWAADPQARPTFEELGGVLGGLLRGSPPPPATPDPLYVNMAAGGGGRDPPEPPKTPPETPEGGGGGPGRYVLCPAPPEPGTPPQFGTPPDFGAFEEGA